MKDSYVPNVNQVIVKLIIIFAENVIKITKLF